MKQVELILFCGLPGAGKSTLARQLEKQTDAIRLCTDEWLAALDLDLFDELVRDKLQNRLYELCKQLLANHQDVILEDGLWSRKERVAKLSDARKLGAYVEIHYFDLTFEELWRRIQQRNVNPGSGVVPLTREQIKKYWPMFQPMNTDELEQFDKHVTHY